MPTLFYKFGGAIKKCFAWRYFRWHLLAMILTYALVISGFDWFYFQWARSAGIRLFLFTAVFLGGILPLLIPLILLAVGRVKNNLRIVSTAWALGQAALLGLLISSFYKAFTGRASPLRSINHFQNFRFGFLRGGIFFGWPSSHTAVAFAMAFALLTLYPQNKLSYLFLIYAFYVGIGVSMTIHWFSDFVAGAIIGATIGIVVGKNFYNLLY